MTARHQWDRVDNSWPISGSAAAFVSSTRSMSHSRSSARRRCVISTGDDAVTNWATSATRCSSSRALTSSAVLARPDQCYRSSVLRFTRVPTAPMPAGSGDHLAHQDLSQHVQLLVHGDPQALRSVRVHDGSFGQGEQLTAESVGEQVRADCEAVRMGCGAAGTHGPVLPKVASPSRARRW